MFFYITDQISAFLPFLILIVFFNIFFSRRKSSMPQERKNPQKQEPVEENVPREKDLAKEFERVLQQKQHPVYKEPVGTEGQIKESVKTMPTPHRPEQAQSPAPRKLRAAQPKLVQGLIMAEVLGKPRSLRPYENDMK